MAKANKVVAKTMQKEEIADEDLILLFEKFNKQLSRNGFKNFKVANLGLAKAASLTEGCRIERTCETRTDANGKEVHYCTEELVCD